MPVLAPPHHQPDEDFINKSLLASLDADADSEPLHSDDSDHPHSAADRPSLSFHDTRPADPSSDHPAPYPALRSHDALYLPHPHALFRPHDDYDHVNYRSSFTAYPNTTRPRQHHHQPLYQPPPFEYPNHFHPNNKPFNYPQQPPFVNPVQLSSQTPYGPHLPANSAPPTATAPNAPPGLSNPAGATGATAPSTGEEISTIFVVGFPEDMQEREFQNMFTFSPGFEAATLKIPNKEYTAYGSLVGSNGTPGASQPVPPINGLRGPAFGPPYPAQQDPFNLVNQVMDGGRDGMGPWNEDLHFTPIMGGMNGLNAIAAAAAANSANQQPRKQIIGFAKFRSREEALVARDVLQGRRVDIEKGAVLKAEMAKKNLHTKRGVGPVAGAAGTTPNGAPVVGPPPSSAGLAANQQPLTNGPDTISDNQTTQRDSLPALARLGIRDSVGSMVSQPEIASAITPTTSVNGSINGLVRGEEEERKRDSIATPLGSLNITGAPQSATGNSSTTSTLRGPRERLEDDERERRRRTIELREQEKREMNLLRLRATNSAAFDAFHAAGASNGSPSASSPVVGPPPGFAGMSATIMSRQSSGATQSSNGGSLSEAGISPMIPSHEVPQHLQQLSPPEDILGPWDRLNLLGPMGRARSETQRSASPTQLQSNAMHKTVSESSQTSDSSGALANSLGHIGQLNGTPVPNGKTEGLNGPVNGGGSSASGTNGTTSPTLPSPASGNSSSAGSISTTGGGSVTSAGLRGTVDQNPPINTLYVGNLPTSPPPMGYPADFLEETLREVFSQRPGYRKLCFRHKAAGPMCFVEFDDVIFASKAMAEMNGNTLRGAVKNGIRLSYSKNPLGVRTPTSAGGNNNPGPTLQQQQQLMQTLSSHHNHQHQHQFAQLGPTDSFQTRLADELMGNGLGQHQHRGAPVPTAILRRDPGPQGPAPFGGGNNHNLGGPGTAGSFLSSTPPRFFSTTTSAMSFTTTSTQLTGASSAFVPRSAAANGVNGGGGYASPPQSFTPFGTFGPPPPPQSAHGFGHGHPHPHLQQHPHSLHIPGEHQSQDE